MSSTTSSSFTPVPGHAQLVSSWEAPSGSSPMPLPFQSPPPPMVLVKRRIKRSPSQDPMRPPTDIPRSPSPPGEETSPGASPQRRHSKTRRPPATR